MFARTPFPHLSPLLLLWLLSWFPPAYADVVKPALIEISAYTGGEIRIEVRASIEAMLTGINARFKNTTESPNAKAYDQLRKLDPAGLRSAFQPFHQRFLKRIWLQADDVPVPLKIDRIVIPEAGYPKVPRISTLILQGQIPPQTTYLTWYYPAAFSDYAVRVRQVDEAQERWHWSEWQWIRNDQPSRPFSLTEVFTHRPITQVIGSYIAAGFAHILPLGLDHILFVLGLFLLSTRLKPLLEQVTMFTVAHSITLGLAMNGIIDLPPRIVEPLIALSIAYVGIENILTPTLRPSRLVIVFGFGLLHGLGFASALTDFGMPKDAFFTALISFNVGVELGQLAVITLAYLSVGLWFGRRPWYRRVIVIPASLAIALVALYWTYDRIVL